MNKVTAAICILVLQCGAATYRFTETGFAGGATVKVAFSGTDTNHDGQIASADGEVDALDVVFSGNTVVAPFALESADADYFELRYDLDGGPLGDGQTARCLANALECEGIIIRSADTGYSVGPGPAMPCDTGADCAAVSDGTAFDYSRTSLQPDSVSVPLFHPRSAFLLVLMFLFAAFGRKRIQ